MIRALWRRLYRAHIQPAHNRGRFAPWCLDCRLLRQAEVAGEGGEYYWHDEPLWMLLEAFRRAEPAEIVGPPPWLVPGAHGTWATGEGQTWAWDVGHGARRTG